MPDGENIEDKSGGKKKIIGTECFYRENQNQGTLCDKGDTIWEVTMAIIQVPMEISDAALAGLLSGDLTRHGGVVRDNLGHIFEHLKDLPTPAQNQKSALVSIADVIKKNKTLIVIGIGVVAVAGGVALYLADKSKRNKQINLPETPKYVEDYNASLCAYLEAVRDGNLDIDTINCLVSDLNTIKENYDSGMIKIDFTTEQLDTLVNLVFNYTRKLAEANSIEFIELREPVYSSEEKTLVDLQRYLKVQKQIFEMAS